MPIFTFMGSSVLRQDDAYSFQIISKIVETIVPVLIKVQNEQIHLNIISTFYFFILLNNIIPFSIVAVKLLFDHYKQLPIKNFTNLLLKFYWNNKLSK